MTSAPDDDPGELRMLGRDPGVKTTLSRDSGVQRIWPTVAIVTFAWVPLVVLGVFARFRAGEIDPVLLRAEPHARLLGALALLSFAEPLLDRRIAMVANSVATDGVLQPSSGAKWSVYTARLRRWRDAWSVNLCWLGVAYGGWAVGHLGLLPGWLARWHSIEGSGATPAWWWYVLVAQPLVVLFALRWAYRWVLWAVLMWRLARLELDLRAIHGDQAGGLGFTRIPLSSLRLFILALGVALASVWYDEISAGRADASSFASDIIAFVGLGLMMVLSPYLAFTPKLIRAREAATVVYAAFMRDYASRFERRWLEQPAEPRDDVLGHPDISALADLRTSGAIVEHLRSLVPSAKDFQLTLIVVALPFVVVAFTQGPSAAQLLRGVVMRLLG